MRRLFTAEECGLTRSALRWGEQQGRWLRVARGVYAQGAAPPSALDMARARVLSAGSTACNSLAGVLHGLDGVALEKCALLRRNVGSDRSLVVAGVPCTDGLQTLVDLAARLDDLGWEQALESALRKRLTTIDAVQAELPALGASRTPGTARIRRVLTLRPAGAPPTESLLETLMVQLIRSVDELPDPTRQYDIIDSYGRFVARVDLCWPGLGLFVELDGQHHAEQPVYDARRETAVVAATGWLVGRFTWHEVVHLPTTTMRRLRALADQARRRPLADAAS